MKRFRLRGVNLVEVMVAAGFVAMALLAILAVQAFGFRFVSGDAVRLEAESICFSILQRSENQLRTDFQQSLNSLRQPVPSELRQGQTEFEYTVTEEPEAGSSELKRVTVKVFWNGSQGEKESSLWCVFRAGE